ncbi:MAG: serine/threonine-protein kinase, partial [Planctomycetota bacterium]|nr:serine/threonine-protein kinase [Planctomycetota bacterium]
MSELGRGGMGIVYRAVIEDNGQQVALKVLKSDDFSQEMIHRFEREGRVLKMLKHPAVVSVFDADLYEGSRYIAMEFIDGLTLDQWVEKKALDSQQERPHQEPPLDPVLAAKFARKRPFLSGSLEDTRTCELLRVIRESALALDYAHSHGIVHRDIKPSNILMTRADQPKVSDFGLAKDLASVSHVTATHELLGTPEYMSPEQCQGDNKKVGPRSDVYSLGVVLYEGVCGRTPFSGSTLFEILSQIKEGEAIHPGKLNSRLDHKLATVIMKCLEKEPERRYGSMAELASDLDNLLKGSKI